MRYGLVAVLFALGVSSAAAQSPELVLKSSSRAVQMEVFVDDTSGHPVHGLKKSDFILTDNGRPRDIQIFSGEVDANDANALPELRALPPGVYSNRFGLHDARIVTALVIDAVMRPDGLQKEINRFPDRPAPVLPRPSIRPEGAVKMALANARGAIYQMAPGEVMAIYAACPDLRVVQDFTSDPELLRASLDAFKMPCAPKAAHSTEARTIEELIPPMLSALTEVVGRLSSAPGRKSVVWVSQAYGTELNAKTIQGATDATIAAFNDANVPLYAADTRFDPVCELATPVPQGRAATVMRSCRVETDASLAWMDGFASATGGRAFTLHDPTGYEEHDAQGRLTYGYTQMTIGEAVSDALLAAVDDSRYAYEMGFYVQDSELDGKLHMLGVTMPSKPKLGLRYRASYTASEEAMTPAEEQTRQTIELLKVDLQSADQVGIDASVAKAGGQLPVSLALDPATVSTGGNQMVSLDATLTETDYSGKELAKVRETVSASAAGTPEEMIRFTRSIAAAKGAALLHVTIRDQSTGREGTVVIPVEKL